MRSCEGFGISKLTGGDGAHELAIEVEQSQPGAFSMVVAGQNDHLVTKHSGVADGLVTSTTLKTLIVMGSLT